MHSAAANINIDPGQALPQSLKEQKAAGREMPYYPPDPLKSKNIREAYQALKMYAGQGTSTLERRINILRCLALKVDIFNNEAHLYDAEMRMPGHPVRQNIGFYQERKTGFFKDKDDTIAELAMNCAKFNEHVPKKYEVSMISAMDAGGNYVLGFDIPGIGQVSWHVGTNDPMKNKVYIDSIIDSIKEKGKELPVEMGGFVESKRYPNVFPLTDNEPYAGFTEYDKKLRTLIEIGMKDESCPG